jgi:hypothetical protein
MNAAAGALRLRRGVFMFNDSHGLPDLVSGELRLGWRSVLVTPALPVVWNHLSLGLQKKNKSVYTKANCQLLIA